MFERIDRLGNLLRSEVRQASKLHGLQPVHVQALQYLNRCNRYSNSPRAVADYLGLTKGTVSQTLLVLERRGLVKKQTDRQDGRISRLHITARGRKTLSDVMPPSTWSRALSGLTRRETNASAALLNRVLLKLQRANRLRTFGACHTCRHLIVQSDHTFRCGLTKETLSAADTQRICWEHEPGGFASSKRGRRRLSE